MIISLSKLSKGLSIFVILSFAVVGNIPVVHAVLCEGFDTESTNIWERDEALACVSAYHDAAWWSENGYTCIVFSDVPSASVNGDGVSYFSQCGRVANTYYGSVISAISVEGKLGGASTMDSEYVAHLGSPFVYLYNAQSGPVSVKLDSVLDTYLPLPKFNATHGWNGIVDTNSKIIIEDKQFDHLFYELGFTSVTLNRNGRNFDSKEALAAYLTHSDFFEKFGFSTQEKKNSLNYFLKKLSEAEVAPYYYLTILDSDAIDKLSVISIDPKPDLLVRDYFVVYPSKVPVQTYGDFKFPFKEKEGIEIYRVKETGELLLPNKTIVFFK